MLSRTIISLSSTLIALAFSLGLNAMDQRDQTDQFPIEPVQKGCQPEVDQDFAQEEPCQNEPVDKFSKKGKEVDDCGQVDNEQGGRKTKK